jgi:serine/threonine protein phosphatase PrpC
VSAFPDITCMQVTIDFEFVLLACDGIWDVMSSKQAVDFIHEKVYGKNFIANRRKKSISDLQKGIEDCLDYCCATDLQSS